MWLFAVFLAVPLIEIALFIQVGGAIGLWATLFIVVATALLGTSLVRRQGHLAMSQIRSSFSELNDPREPLAHGAMILFSGALLLTPGFFTDAVGFALLIPSVRGYAYRYLASRVKVQSFAFEGGSPDPSQGPSGNDTIDGDWSEIKDDPSDWDQRPSGSSGWTKH